MPLQLGFGEACGFLKMFRDYWWLQQYIYGFILVMLLYDLVTSGFDIFLVYFYNLVYTAMTTRLVCFYCV